VDSESTSTVNLVPNPERIYGEHLPELRFCYEVYIPEGTAHQDSLRTQFEIISSNNGNRIVLEDGPTVPHREGNYALTGTSQLRGIQEEDLELVVHVVDSQGRVLAERKGTFHVYWPLVNWGDDFELSLAQLELVAPGDVVSEYKKCAPEEREPFLKTYWNSRDPVPQTEQNELLVEFEKRLRHAKRQLGGIWTDRSKVYIQNGSPQEMSRRMVRDAFGYPRPAEIWVYFDPYREFVFVEDRLVRR
jgi:GWxTD domain-containing protein